MVMTIDAAMEAEVEREHYSMAGQQHRDLVTRLYEGLRLLFADRTDRLVLAEVTTMTASGRMMIPDIAVVFGLPQQQHRSYRVGTTGPAPRVVLEVVSPMDTDEINATKLGRHLELGTEELWFLHVRTGSIERFIVLDGAFVPVPAPSCAALEDIRFEPRGGTVEPVFADGTPFPLHAAAEAARATAEAARAARLAERLRAAGLDPDD
ncbi:MAG: Uma2 family endonuclease [Acidimicrobiia bacterium]